jgi:hypothetical protein
MAVALQGSPVTVTLPAGRVLSVVAGAMSSGRLFPFSERVGDTPGLTAVAAGQTVTVGPFASPARYQIECLSGSLSYSDAAVDFPSLAEALAAAAAAAALAHVPVSGTVGDVRDVIGEGVPADTATATVNVNPTGDDNSLTFTAVTPGAAGNNITITYVDPSANDAELSVDVTGTDIVVNLATGGAGAITSTAAQVLAAIEASPAADALVAVTIHTGDTGSGDDGSGVVTAMAETPLANGADGDGHGVAGKGSRYTDITNGTLYLNTGTKASPAWTQLAPVG